MTRPNTNMQTPHALDDAMVAIDEELAGKRIAVFLDYDGTLTPIINQPEKAYMPEDMREIVATLSQRFDTSIVTGRSRDKIVNFVQLDSLYYAASHGFDVLEPEGKRASEFTQVATEYLPLLGKARDSIGAALHDIEGAFVEDNVFSVSVHYRQCKNHEEVIPRIQAIVSAFLDDIDGASPQKLRVSHGKCVFEMSPALDWNKGKAVEYLMNKLGYADSSQCVAIYIGDDTSDEHAFKALGERGISILVSDVQKDTSARYHVKDPFEVGQFLRHISELVPIEGRAASGDPACEPACAACEANDVPSAPTVAAR